MNDQKITKATLDKLKDLPFRILISFKILYDYWENVAGDPDHHLNTQALNVLESVAHVPELREPFSEMKLLNTYKDEIKMLLSGAFPEMLTDNEIKAGSVPFLPVFFNPSRRFAKILKNAGNDFEFFVRDFNVDDVYKLAGSFYLQSKYGVDIKHKQSMFFDIPDEDSGTMKHYRALFNGDFCDFRENGNERNITEEEIQSLVDNYNDIELWKKIIPPQSYDFVGFGLITLLDVTTDQALSELKDKLLQKDVLLSGEKVADLEKNIKSYLKMADIKLGLASYDHAAKRISSLGTSGWSSLILHEQAEIERREGFCNFSIDKIFKNKEKFIVSNIQPEHAKHSSLLATLIENDVKSVILAPLVYGDEVLGILELTSKEKNTLNSVVAEQLNDLLPLFTVAMKRTLDEYETSLEAIVQEQFTSIHPSVSWKFFDAAEKVLAARRLNKVVDPEPIVFNDVVPLYGQFDIRGSSQARNDAIQADLVCQLFLAKKVFEVACETDAKPIYSHLLHRIQVYKDHLEDEIHAGDEVKILDFLKKEIYPVFRFLKTENKELKQVISQYEDALDSDLQVVYQKRKAYEETVTILNEKISDYVERQEEKAQKMYPHYFEKYKTDGVEYNIYVGASIVQARDYHPIHLQNLRLWQLLVTCGVERLVRKLEPSLPIQLQIASLILAHNSPLAIKFRMDEKQFDVDGAYNIRYEIMKKRIDKAYVKGTSERLTQPGKIAIVYSQESEAEEYRRYLEYLQSNGYIALGIEELTLQDLQGTTGLKALRVNVLFDDSEEAQIEELLQATLQS